MQLDSFVASQPGWTVVEYYEDNASGAKGPDQRPGLTRMLHDAALDALVEAAHRVLIDAGHSQSAVGSPDLDPRPDASPSCCRGCGSMPRLTMRPGRCSAAVSWS